MGCLYSLDWTTGLDYWTGKPRPNHAHIVENTATEHAVTCLVHACVLSTEHAVTRWSYAIIMA